MIKIGDLQRGDIFHIKNSDPEGPDHNGVVHGTDEKGLVWSSSGWGMGVSVSDPGTPVFLGHSKTGWPRPK